LCGLIVKKALLIVISGQIEKQIVVGLEIKDEI